MKWARRNNAARQGRTDASDSFELNALARVDWQLRDHDRHVEPREKRSAAGGADAGKSAQLLLKRGRLKRTCGNDSSRVGRQNRAGYGVPCTHWWN